MKSFRISCRKFLFQWSLIIQNNIVVLFPRYPQKNRILPPRGNLPPVWNHCVREKQENKTKLNVRRCGERKLVDCVQHSARSLQSVCAVECIHHFWSCPLIASLGCTLHCITTRIFANIASFLFVNVFVRETCNASERQKFFGMTNLHWCHA